jgi:bacteriocin biosynthesis cyclodehydratase domain-containing protein
MLEKIYEFNKYFTTYDNGIEICTYSAIDSKGYTIRGLGAELFRTLTALIKERSFSIEDVISAKKSKIDIKDWNDFLSSLEECNIIVQEGFLESERIISNIQEKHIGLCGSPQLISLILPMLHTMGFSSFMVEGNITNQDMQHEVIPITYREQLSAEDMASLDLIVLLDDTQDIHKHQLINSAVMRNNLLFLSARLVGNSFELGPLVIPGKSACFNCYWQRAQASTLNSSPPSWYLDLEKRACAVSETDITHSLYSLAAHYIAIECWRCVTSLVCPTTLDRVIQHNIIHSTSQTHPILELPGCHACALADEWH